MHDKPNTYNSDLVTDEGLAQDANDALIYRDGILDYDAHGCWRRSPSEQENRARYMALIEAGAALAAAKSTLATAKLKIRSRKNDKALDIVRWHLINAENKIVEEMQAVCAEIADMAQLTGRPD